MKKIVLLSTLLICCMCFMDNVYATCLKEDVDRVTELAKNITVNYEFAGEKDYDDVSQLYLLSFDFAGLENEVYLTEVNHKTRDFFSSSESFMVEAGKYSFDVYYKGCEGVKVRTIEFELKEFNKYSSRDECKGLQGSVDICDEWYQGNITDDYFDNYMKKNYPKKFKFDINFISEYKWYVISGFGVIAILGIIVMIRGMRKNRLD